VENYRDPFAIAVVSLIGSSRRSRPKKDIDGMFDVFKTRWDYQLQRYWQQTLF